MNRRPSPGEGMSYAIADAAGPTDDQNGFVFEIEAASAMDRSTSECAAGTAREGMRVLENFIGARSMIDDTARAPE
jgi:hypothetical protein